MPTEGAVAQSGQQWSLPVHHSRRGGGWAPLLASQALGLMARTPWSRQLDYGRLGTATVQADRVRVPNGVSWVNRGWGWAGTPGSGCGGQGRARSLGSGLASLSRGARFFPRVTRGRWGSPGSGREARVPVGHGPTLSDTGHWGRHTGRWGRASGRGHFLCASGSTAM